MTQILRPPFGQPCSGSNCDNIVPAPRARELRQRKEAAGFSFRPGDILCVRCGREADMASTGIEPARRR
jgi:hypothetical protein